MAKPVMMLMTLQATAVFGVGRVEAAADQLFVLKHYHFRRRALSGVDLSPSSQPATFPDHLDVPVARIRPL
jgi:hypothetical protein